MQCTKTMLLFKTITMGDFHPHNCVHIIFIVLLLSELHGSLGSFRLLTDFMKGRRVSWLPCPVFFNMNMIG